MIESAEQRPEETDDLGLTNFFSSIGNRVIAGGTHLWYEVGPRTFFPLPFNEPFSMSPADLKLMWESGALLLRYPGLESQSGFPGYMFLVTKEDYGLADMNGKSRNQTRRGIENCTVRQISFDYLLHHGQLLISDTLRRQDRVMSVKVGQYWQKFFTSAAACPALEAYGAFVQDRLAAYLVAMSIGSCIHIHMVFSRSEFLKYYPINALTFVFAQEAIRRPNISCVSYGMRSIKGDRESLNKFKQGMGFTKVLVQERIEVNPRLKFLFDSGIARAGAVISKRFSGRSELVANIHGLLSTYLAQEGSTNDAGQPSRMDEVAGSKT
jgi:hypothetical protein